MAILRLENCGDNYLTADLPFYFSQVPANFIVGTANGRVAGSNAIYANSTPTILLGANADTYAVQNLVKPFNSNLSRVIIGVAIKRVITSETILSNSSLTLIYPYSGGSISYVPCAMMQLWDSVRPQLNFSDTNTGAIEVRQLYFYASTYYLPIKPLYTTVPNILPKNQWCFLEIDVTASQTNLGSITFYVNGKQVDQITGINTGLTTFFAGLGLGGGLNNLYDDIYIADGTGTVNNAPVGDTTIITRLPNAAGANTNFTPTGAASNYVTVNEAAQDGDTTYVSNGTVGTVDTYIYPALPGTINVIRAIQPVFIARKDDIGNRSVSAAFYNGTANFTNAQTSAIGISYNAYPQVFNLSPVSGVAWTATEANTFQFGQSVQ